jgi:hypothetical protein
VLYYGHLEHALLLSARVNGAPVTFLGNTTARLPWEEATLQAQRGH